MAITPSAPAPPSAMRLVCEQCSAVHTIEDNLVGERDFHVACKQCGKAIFVRHDRALVASSSAAQITPSVELAERLSPRPARPPASFAPSGHEQWFVWLSGKQEGPFHAREVAALLEQGEMAWTSEVWRDGFKDWRHARRDATLVTAVAGARGAANDTMRLNAARSFLAPEDTIVEARPNLFATSSQRLTAAPREELLSSASDTQAIDARDLPDHTEPIAGALQAAMTSEAMAPQQWHSPENAAFRAGLGFAQPSQEAPVPVRPVAHPVSSAPAPSRGDAFRSAPTLLRGGRRPLPVMEPSAEYEPTETWLPKPRSLLVVAVLAFGGGVVAAALASRYVAKKPESSPVSASVAFAAPAAAPKVVHAPPPAATPNVAAAPEPPAAEPAIEAAPIPANRELPTPEELRREVRRVASDVRRCITDPATGVEVGVFIDGASGRVREIDVRSARLTPARVDCVIHAVKQIELAPFKRNELRLEHKFSW